MAISNSKITNNPKTSGIATTKQESPIHSDEKVINVGHQESLVSNRSSGNRAQNNRFIIPQAKSNNSSSFKSKSTGNSTTGTSITESPGRSVASGTGFSIFKRSSSKESVVSDSSGTYKKRNNTTNITASTKGQILSDVKSAVNTGSSVFSESSKAVSADNSSAPAEQKNELTSTVNTATKIVPLAGKMGALKKSFQKKAVIDKQAGKKKELVSEVADAKSKARDIRIPEKAVGKVGGAFFIGFGKYLIVPVLIIMFVSGLFYVVDAIVNAYKHAEDALHAPTSNVESVVYNYLKGKGYNDIAVAGIMANIYQESGMDPECIQKTAFFAENGISEDEFDTIGYDETSADLKLKTFCGYGLFQWSGNRVNDLQAYANDYGESISWKNLTMQLDFFSDEATGKGITPEAINACTDENAATEFFYCRYEMSTGTNTIAEYTTAHPDWKKYMASRYLNFTEFSEDISGGNINRRKDFAVEYLANIKAGAYEGGLVLGSTVYPVPEGSGSISTEFHQMLGDPPYAHQGIDIAVPIGTPVYAVCSGQINESGNIGNGYGVTIYEIANDASGTEYTIVYGHLSETLVSVGETVTAGQLIGYSGNTGNSGGPHLHLGIYPGPENGHSGSVNPWTFINHP